MSHTHWCSMETKRWCQKFSFSEDFSGILRFSEKQMQQHDYLSHDDYEILGENSRYWDWYTRDIEDPDVLRLLNFLESRHDLPVNTSKTRLALWEYHKGDLLLPHVDVDISLSTSIVVSLVGRFETYLHDSVESGRILDTVEYGPGDYIILNNTKYCHGGRPLEDYRLAMIVFVDPSYDMTEFWSR